MRRSALVLVAVFTVTGCTATTAGRSDPATTVTMTTTATSVVTTTVSASPTGADPELAARLATLACQDYVFAGTLDAASGSAPLDEAGSTATAAAVADPAWSDLAGALAFLAALPLTDNTADDQTRAGEQLTVVQERCADAGVTVIS